MSLRLVAVLTATLSFALPARAQLPACVGDDAAGAGAEFEEGNALLGEATSEARARHRDRARELAAQALAHFDRQCELGDEGALAERGAALMLMGEPLRSAQSYDAYLRDHPLESLDARTRRRIEPNLQPGVLTITTSGSTDAHVFVDDLDFGGVSRDSAIRLPYGSYHVEARDGATVLVALELTLSPSSPAGVLSVTGAVAAHVEDPDTEVADPHEDPDDEREEGRAATPVSSHYDYTGWYVLTGTATGVFLATGVVFQLLADERARTYNAAGCPAAVDCDAVLRERDGELGGMAASYILGGVAAIGLVTVLVLDLTQPAASGTASAACVPTADPSGAGVACAGRF